MNAVFKPLAVSYASAFAHPGKADQPKDPEQAIAEVNALMMRCAGTDPKDLTSRMAAHQLRTGGKQIRARLALHACDCFRVSHEQAVVWAAAVELLHNATLVHDDVQDADVERRGQPTVWSRFGVAQAINAGDYLLMLPFLLLGELPVQPRAALSPLVADFATRIVRGQADDLLQNAAGPVDFDRYVKTCEGKTGALLALPVVGAAMLGGASQADAHRFAMPFVQLGVLFQLQDDVVDLFGDKGRGQMGSDVYEGKVTSLLVSLMARRPDLTQEVRALLAKPRHQKSPEQVEWVRTQYEQSGALGEVLARIARIGVQVQNSAILGLEPKLMAVAQRLIAMATAPIQHLL